MDARFLLSAEQEWDSVAAEAVGLAIEHKQFARNGLLNIVTLEGR